MAKQVIGIGTSANDGTGDPVRDAFDKANDNFTENYDSIALNAPLAANNTFTGNNTFTKLVQIGAPVNLTIDAGDIIATSSYVIVSGAGAVPDNLVSISGAATAGAIIILRPLAEVITVLESGNIILGAASRVLTVVADRLMLQYDGTNWCEISYSDNS